MAEKTQVAKETATESKYVNRVKETYKKEVVPYLVKKFNYKNVNQAPKLVKITINGGLGDVKDNAKSVQLVEKELSMIAGQKPVLTKAKKSVAKTLYCTYPKIVANYNLEWRQGPFLQLIAKTICVVSLVRILYRLILIIRLTNSTQNPYRVLLLGVACVNLP